MTEQPVICQKCHAEMEAGKKTHSKVMEFTEYTCPKCASIWSDGKPLPRHEPVYPMAIETEAEAGVYADDLLEEVVESEGNDGC